MTTNNINMDFGHYRIQAVSKWPPLAAIQSLKRFFKFSAMGRSSSGVILSHSRRNDCFSDFKLLWGLAQALASKIDHTL